MARPLKLYNYAQAPNPRRVRIFAAEKGIELSLEEVDILAGQSRTPEFLAKNSSGAVPVLELDDDLYLVRVSCNLPVYGGASTRTQPLRARLYGWFTEGFDTRDLKEAKALLEELAA